MDVFVWFALTVVGFAVLLGVVSLGLEAWFQAGRWWRNRRRRRLGAVESGAVDEFGEFRAAMDRVAGEADRREGV